MFEPKNMISQEPRINIFIYSGALVCALLIYCTTLFFPSWISPQVSKFNFSYFIPYLIPLAKSRIFPFLDCLAYLGLLALIPMVELKNPISQEQRMSFLLYLGALVSAFLISCTTLFSPSSISPQVSKFKYSNFIPYIAPLALIRIVELKNLI